MSVLVGPLYLRFYCIVGPVLDYTRHKNHRYNGFLIVPFCGPLYPMSGLQRRGDAEPYAAGGQSPAGAPELDRLCLIGPLYRTSDFRMGPL
jgi:hypothetical protein